MREEVSDKVKVVHSNTLRILTAYFSQSDVLKKASDLGSELGKQAQKAAERISETTGQITDTAAYKKVSEVKRRNGTTVSEAKHDLVYSDWPPWKKKWVMPRSSRVNWAIDLRQFFANAVTQIRWRKRRSSLLTRQLTERMFRSNDERVFSSETQTVAVHKDSQWYQNWQNFKDNNTYLNSSSPFLVDYRYHSSLSLSTRIIRSEIQIRWKWQSSRPCGSNLYR